MILLAEGVGLMAGGAAKPGKVTCLCATEQVESRQLSHVHASDIVEEWRATPQHFRIFCYSAGLACST